jgi:hypothetical protein
VSDADRKATENPRQSDGVKERASQHYQEFLGEEEHTLLVTMKPYVDKVQELYSKWKIAPDAERREITKQMNAVKRECVGILDKGTPWEGDNSYADEVFVDVNERQGSQFKGEFIKAENKGDKQTLEELKKDTFEYNRFLLLELIRSYKNDQKEDDAGLRDGVIDAETYERSSEKTRNLIKEKTDSLRRLNERFGK